RAQPGGDAARAALDRGAGRPPPAAAPDIFSRTVQAGAGLGVGMIALGAALGALFAVCYAVCLGRVGGVRPRSLALLVAAGGFTGTYLVPFVKYPANPPGIGNPDTIGQRGGVYLLMVGCSVVFLVLAGGAGAGERDRELGRGRGVPCRSGRGDGGAAAAGGVARERGGIRPPGNGTPAAAGRPRWPDRVPGVPRRCAVQLPVVFGRRAAAVVGHDRAGVRPAGRPAAAAPARRGPAAP